MASRLLKAPRALALAAVVAVGFSAPLMASEHGEEDPLTRAELLAAALAGDASARPALEALFGEALGDSDAIVALAVELIESLAGDSVEGIRADAQALAAEVDRLLEIEMPGDEHFWHEHGEVATVRRKALELTEGPDIEPARAMYADLSVAFGKLLEATGVPPTYSTEIHQLHCPMYRAQDGGVIWMQPKGDVRNPFFGSTMLRCFDERSVLPRTGRLE